MRKSILVLVFALTFTLSLTKLSFAELVAEQWCFQCPPGTTLTLFERDRYYCMVTGTSQSAGVPLWAKPSWAKVMWDVQGGRCLNGYIRFGEDFCYRCPGGYQFSGSALTDYRRTSCKEVKVHGWQQVRGRRGAIQQVADGLMIVGDTWTNGAVKNGFRDGNGIESKQVFDLTGGAQCRLKFSVSGNGKYMAITNWLATGIGGKSLSTNNSWHGSAVVPQRIWLYANADVAANGNYTLTVSKDGYDGASITSVSGRLSNMRVRLGIEFIDNHAGKNAAIIINHAEVCPY
ncbi:MAG: hypothetical protein OEM02_04530 [Desulfobulbaceae bacterium]|nr:hypothetical protein [Desulfobulbaceae bacterium]